MFPSIYLGARMAARMVPAGRVMPVGQRLFSASPLANAGRVQDKVALITGGGKGLGRATAQLLAKEGALVIVTDIDAEHGEDVVSEITVHGGSGLFLEHDTSNEEAWKSVMGAIKNRYGRLDITYNDAGIGTLGNVEETSYEDWKKLKSINDDGVFLGTKYSVELMKENKSGSIINASSILGAVGDPNAAAYNASKGSVRIFTKSAALHCARNKLGIRVNSIHPGYIFTPMVGSFAAPDVDADKATVEQAKMNPALQHLIDLHPVGHLGVPMDIAYGVLYLASDESSFVTGTELYIDGGYTAQ